MIHVMSPFALQSILTAIFETEMEDQELQLSPYSEQRVEHMVSIGVERMTMDNIIEKQEKVHLAEENIKRLYRILIRSSKSLWVFSGFGRSCI